MAYTSEGRSKHAVAVGFGGNVKWPHYKERFRNFGSLGEAVTTLSLTLALFTVNIPPSSSKTNANFLLTPILTVVFHSNASFLTQYFFAARFGL
jgi:hypothetical protein